jgi:RNA polymerase sigma factor (sigma-70 family)
MAPNEGIFSELQEGRRRFLALVEDVRPDLHRYCARMTGSIIDGEDVVQDTLARAYYELAELKEMPALRPWLFRVAHNRAIDYLRSYGRRMSEQLDAASDVAADEGLEPDNALARDEAVRAAVSRFLEVAPVQRSCVILKDVFDYSLEEIGNMLDLSVSAVKSALVRGRARLRNLSEASAASPKPEAQLSSVSPTLVSYTKLFNLRDWDGVRAMLVDEVKLELVSRLKRAGRLQVSSYFGNYDSIGDWWLAPGRLDGREVLAVFLNKRDTRPSYFIELTVVDNRVTFIRDFRYVSYIMSEGLIELADLAAFSSASKRRDTTAQT